MAGYIGSKASVTQVDGYTQTEAESRYANVSGDTFTGAVTGTDLTLSGGVYLGGTGSANKLDDYEGGTWTPSMSGGGYVFSNQAGTYTKIGRQVFVRGKFQITTVGTNTSAISLSGLPFTSSNNISQGHFIGVCREVLSNGALFVCQVNLNSTVMGINSMNGVNSGDNHVFTAHVYNFNVMYETA